MATDSGWSSLFRPQCYCPFSLFTDDDDRSCEKFIPPRTTDIELPQRINWVFSSASLSFHTLFLPLKYRGSHCPHLSLSVCVLTLVTLPCMQIYRSVERRTFFLFSFFERKEKSNEEMLSHGCRFILASRIHWVPLFLLDFFTPSLSMQKERDPECIGLIFFLFSPGSLCLFSAHNQRGRRLCSLLRREFNFSFLSSLALLLISGTQNKP